MRLTKRGKRVRALAILAGVALFSWWMIQGLWWTDTGFCVGTMAECVGF
jgi:hypothetical protein